MLRVFLVPRVVSSYVDAVELWRESKQIKEIEFDMCKFTHGQTNTEHGSFRPAGCNIVQKPGDWPQPVALESKSVCRYGFDVPNIRPFINSEQRVFVPSWSLLVVEEDTTRLDPELCSVGFLSGCEIVGYEMCINRENGDNVNICITGLYFGPPVLENSILSW